MPKALSIPDLLRLGGEHAEQILIRQREKQLSTLVHLVDKENKTYVIMPVWRNDIQKQIIMHDVKVKARQIGARLAMVVHEMWQYPEEVIRTLRTKADMERMYQICRPSEHPQRREGVMAIATDGNKWEYRMWQTVRDRPAGRTILLVEMFQPEGVRVESPLLEGLVPPPDSDCG